MVSPVSVGILGLWTKTILRRMGRPERAFSVHRRGAVTRACITCILRAQGKELPEGQLQALVRWGGWTGVTGVMTVMKTYAGKVIDEYLDVYGLAYARDSDASEWAAKLDEYRGHPIFPSQLISDAGCRPVHMQIKLLARSLVAWQEHQGLLNRLFGRILAAAALHTQLQPICRYQEDRKFLNAALKKFCHQSDVIAYLQAKRGSHMIFADCCLHAERRCLRAWLSTQAGSWASSVSITVQRLACMQCLEEWEPGMVGWNGHAIAKSLPPGKCSFLPRPDLC